MKTYTELIRLPTFEERLEYLKIPGIIGAETFGIERYLNQNFYHSREWKDYVRPRIITRDLGRDMALEGYELYDDIIIHHINPITMEDVVDHNEIIVDPENLVCVSRDTHNLIHYGNMAKQKPRFIVRAPHDTVPWR